MIRKFVGDKMSIEAHSDDQGRTWAVSLFDRGHLTKYKAATQAELDKLVADRRMRATSPR